MSAPENIGKSLLQLSRIRLCLAFYKRISDGYIEEIKKLTERLGDEELARDPRMHDFVVPDDALWDNAFEPEKKLISHRDN